MPFLDYTQVIQNSFDESASALRTTATAIIAPTGSVNIIIAASADSVALGSSDGASTATFTSLTGKTGLDVNVINHPPVQAVSGSALTATIAGTANVNVTDALAISSIVPVAVSGTASVSGNAITSVLTSPAHSVGTLVAPYGYLRTAGEGSPLFFDEFDSVGLDTNQWVTASVGNSSVSVSTSLLTLSTGTTAGNAITAYSIPAFTRGRWGFTQVGMSVALEAGNLASVERFWGLGDLTDGIGFELTNATMRAVVYQSGSAVFSSSINKPTDGKLHTYIILSRVDQTYWYMDGFDVFAASSQYTNPNVSTLPLKFIMQNTGSPPQAPTFNVMAVGIQSSDNTVVSVADGTYPWKKSQFVSNSINVTEGIASTASALNSTTAALTANATYTGSWESVTSFSSYVVTVDTNVDSAASGWLLQFSNDGINIDVQKTHSFASANGTSDVCISYIQAKYMRVVYTNGASPQSYFRLNTSFKKYPEGPADTIVSSITDQSLALRTKTVLVGKTTGAGGGYVTVKVNPSGTLTTDASGSVVSVSGTTAVSGTVSIKATTGTFTDFSGNAGVTSTQFAPANTNRKYLLIFNQSSSINIAVNFGASASMNAAGSIQIGPKGSFIMENSWVTTQSVNIVSGSGTPPVTVKEGT